MRKIRYLLAILCFFCTASACHSTPSMTDAWPKPTPCAKCVLQARQMYCASQVPGTSQWRVLSGEDEGTVISQILTITADNIVTIEEPEIRITKIQFRPDGSCALISVESMDNATRSEFDPPLLMCGPELRFNTALQSDSPMRVVQIEDGAQRDQGIGTRTTIMDGTARITTPLGTFDCVVVSTHFIGALAHATMDRTVTTWVAPELGAIAENNCEKIKILGVFIKSSERLIVKLPQKL